MTVKELREAIKDIDDNVEIEVINPYQPGVYGTLKEVYHNSRQQVILEFW